MILMSVPLWGVEELQVCSEMAHQSLQAYLFVASKGERNASCIHDTL